MECKGKIAYVEKNMGDGAVLKLDTGELLEFSSYDRYDTNWWLPPYRVLITGSYSDMWNIDAGKKVWIKRVLR